MQLSVRRLSALCHSTFEQHPLCSLQPWIWVCATDSPPSLCSTTLSCPVQPSLRLIGGHRVKRPCRSLHSRCVSATVQSDGRYLAFCAGAFSASKACGFSARPSLSWTWISGRLDSNSALSARHCLCSQGFNPLQSFRFGEAQHPAPVTPCNDQQVIRVMVVNPTAVHRKEDIFNELAADVFGIAETSAVAGVQHSFASGMRQYGYHTTFGAPVAVHGRDGRDTMSLRGMAGGVAIASKLPCRPSPAAFKPAIAQSTRIMETMLRFGALEVRGICLYGVPQSHSEAKDLNNALLTSAWDRISQNKVPALIMGDMNIDIQTLPVWVQFQQLGYVEAFSAVKAKFDIDLPPTCKMSTRFDTAILAPALVECLVSAQVLSACHAFDAHSPLQLDFARPSELPCLHRWRLPKPWTDFPVQPAALALHYNARCQSVTDAVHGVNSREELTGAFQVWAGALEAAVDASLQQDGSRGLPRAYRGRCQAVRRVPCPVQQLPKRARRGDFQPQVEVVSLQCKQRLRQCRRAKTLLQGLRKFGRTVAFDPAQLQQLFNEWHAIQRAPGYNGPFCNWVLSWEFMVQFPLDFPTEPYLEDLVRLLEYDCEAMAAQEAQLRRQAFKQHVLADESFDYSRQGFKSLKGVPKPPFTAVSTVLRRWAVPSSAGAPGEWHFPLVDAHLFRAGLQVEFQGEVGVVVASDNGIVHVAFGQDVPAQGGELIQCHQDCTPEELHLGFKNFWHTYWMRDSVVEEQDAAQWGSFMSLLRQFPCPWADFTLDMQDVNLWVLTCRKMKSRSASGACGFSVRELKMLPHAALQHLADLFHQATKVGLPDFLLLGRVNVLTKTVDPQGYNDGRPICVLTVLYRAWTSVFCQQVLRKWSPFLPHGLYGVFPADQQGTSHFRCSTKWKCHVHRTRLYQALYWTYRNALTPCHGPL